VPASIGERAATAHNSLILSNGDSIRSIFLLICSLTILTVATLVWIEDRRGPSMNCYVCSAEDQERSCAAVAICQQCGAGMCQDHLFTLKGATSVGMAGNVSRRLICSACHGLLIVHYRKPRSSARGQTYPPQKWWNRWRRPKEAELPAPQDAVMAAERFLQTKRQ
jgi:hypothetical protein